MSTCLYINMNHQPVSLVSTLVSRVAFVSFCFFGFSMSMFSVGSLAVDRAQSPAALPFGMLS